MDHRADESCNLKRKLGFNLHDVINNKEQTVLKSIKGAFEGEDMQTHYSVLGYRIDLYFCKYKLATEVDELGHVDRNLSNEIERQRALEKELDFVFIRINPDEENFNISKEINKIHGHIKKSNQKLTEQLTKKSLNDDLSKRLLELEFKPNHSIKRKCLKWIVKKILPDYKEWKTQSRIKLIKTGKEIGTTYCLGCKDYTPNFKLQEVKMTKCLEKNQTVLFANLVNQDFSNKNNKK